MKMTEKQLRREVRDATLALYEHLPTHHANDPRWQHEAFQAELARIIVAAREEALKDAARTECVLCRTGEGLHYAEEWALPFHKVNGRVRSCAARLIHNLSRSPRPSSAGEAAKEG